MKFQLQLHEQDQGLRDVYNEGQGQGLTFLKYYIIGVVVLDVHSILSNTPSGFLTYLPSRPAKTQTCQPIAAVSTSSATAKSTARPSCLVGVFMTFLGRKSVDG